MRLWRRRFVLVPTTGGWALLLIVAALPVTAWALYGEQFLSTTARVPADVLIVEAWLEDDGAAAGVAEYTRPDAGYRCLVAAGGLTGQPWSRRRWHEVEIVELELRRHKFPADAFVAAEARDVNIRRTYESAIAARDALARRGIRPTGINVVTRGSHARRSRLVFQKAFGNDVPVGVISWQPPGYAELRWWQSSERAVDFMKESFGYVYEALFSSGRWFVDRDSARATNVSQNRPNASKPAVILAYEH